IPTTALCRGGGDGIDDPRGTGEDRCLAAGGGGGRGRSRGRGPAPPRPPPRGGRRRLRAPGLFFPFLLRAPLFGGRACSPSGRRCTRPASRNCTGAPRLRRGR